MPLVYWDFNVSGKSGDKNDRQLEPHARGIYTASAEDVEKIAGLAGFEIKGWDRAGIKQRKIDVKEPEDSERLVMLLAAIEEKYGFKPSSSRIVPLSDRDHVFGLTKYREYTLSEIDDADFLHISLVEKAIADWCERTDDEINEEHYSVEKRKQKTKVPFGFISPFLAIAVTTELKHALAEAGLVGLDFDPVVNSKHLWKLTSAFTMPRCRLPIVNGQGEIVDPGVWPGKWSDKYYDDAGYEPPELLYRRSEVAQLGGFDIAVTAERTGGYKKTSFRRLIVSQNFRRALEGYGVKGVQYTPVRLGD